MLAEPKTRVLGVLELDEGAKGEGEGLLLLGPVGATKMFDDVFGFGFAVNAKGLETVEVAVPEPKGVFISDGVALAGEPVCSSVDSVANRTCLLLCNPPRDDPLPLLLVADPFWPLCSRFAAFSSRSFSNGSTDVVALGDGLAEALLEAPRPACPRPLDPRELFEFPRAPLALLLLSSMVRDLDHGEAGGTRRGVFELILCVRFQ